tara:strand:+ start:1772 stop:1894 length:123 start_codon:yes stop_codon:yes gene_type:complete
MNKSWGNPDDILDGSEEQKSLLEETILKLTELSNGEENGI